MARPVRAFMAGLVAAVISLVVGMVVHPAAAGAADPFGGYVLSYFGGTPYLQALHLATSADGLHWTTLNSNYPVLSARTGTTFVRDPYVLRKQDGGFVVLATQGWDTDSVYIWDSADLVTFTDARLVKINDLGGRTWAPQAIWDPVAKNYIVYWSGPAANGGYNRTYYNTTTDFRTFSPAQLYFAAGVDNIDADIVQANGTYHLYYKNNTTSTIYEATSTSLTPNSWTKTNVAVSPQGVEGPTTWKSNVSNTWYMYYDILGGKGIFGLRTNGNLDSPKDWTERSDFALPTGVRHATVFPVTAAEMKRITTAWTPNRFVSQSNDRCLDVRNADRSDGAQVRVLDCNGAAAQNWVPTPAGEMRAVDRCLDQKANGAAGTVVTMWRCTGAGNQKWDLAANGAIVNRQTKLCLDVSGGGTPPNATKTVVWPCADQKNQRWVRN
jgi:hypothetical protein